MTLELGFVTSPPNFAGSIGPAKSHVHPILLRDY